MDSPQDKPLSVWNQLESRGFFPLLIRLKDGSNRRIICYGPENLPNSESFIVLETNCNIEVRYTPAMYLSVNPPVKNMSKGE